MRKTITLLALLITLLSVSQAIARGANNDDCAPGSADPDCVDASKKGK